jgi:succinate dehydrogenase/fumarate reductase flavoprotein subunit
VTTHPAEFQVVVVGSGAAGMTAALAAAHHGLRVVVVEKTGQFGGSTARSGGGLWVPGNEVLRRAGVADTPEQARTYLAHVVDGCVTAARQQALLEHGPAMLTRHQGRPAHRRPGPGAAPRRHPDRRAVCGGQHQRSGDGPQLRRRGRDDRPGHDVRLHCRARPRQLPLIFMQYE